MASVIRSGRSAAVAVCVLSLVGAVGAVLTGAGRAGAAPYSDQTTLSVSSQSPTAGASFTLGGAGFDPLESVAVTMTPGYTLGSSRADTVGDFSATVQIPSDAIGAQTITATGETSHRSISASIDVMGTSANAPATTGTAGPSTAGPLATAGAGTPASSVPTGPAPTTATKRAHTTRVTVPNDSARANTGGGYPRLAVAAIGVGGALLLAVGAWLVVVGRRRRNA